MSHAIRGRVASLTGSTALFAALLYGVSMMRPVIISFPAEKEQPPLISIGPTPFIPPPPAPSTKHEEPVDTGLGPIIDLPPDTSITQPPQTPIEIAPRSDLVGASWIHKPSTDELLDYYPEVALSRGIGGRVVLDCVVGTNGRIACSVAQETPTGKGFGRAAMDASRLFKMSPMMSDGRPTEGGRIQVPITFELPKG